MTGYCLIFADRSFKPDEFRQEFLEPLVGVRRSRSILNDLITTSFAVATSSVARSRFRLCNDGTLVEHHIWDVYVQAIVSEDLGVLNIRVIKVAHEP